MTVNEFIKTLGEVVDGLPCKVGNVIAMSVKGKSTVLEDFLKLWPRKDVSYNVSAYGIGEIQF